MNKPRNQGCRLALALVVGLLLSSVSAWSGMERFRPGDEDAARWALLINGGDSEERAAEELASILVERYGFSADRVITLAGGRATWHEAADAMENIQQRLEPYSHLFIYISLPVRQEEESVYFLPRDGREGQPWTWLDLQMVFRWLGELPAESILFAYPSCPERSSFEEELFENQGYRSRKEGQLLDVLQICYPEARFAWNELPEGFPSEDLRRQTTELLVGVFAEDRRQVSSVELADGLTEAADHIRARIRPIPEFARSRFVFTLVPSQIAEYRERYLTAGSPPESEKALISLTEVARSDDTGALHTDAVELLTEIALATDALLPAGSGDAALRLAMRRLAVEGLGRLGSGEAKDALGKISSQATDEPAIRRESLSQISRLANPRAGDLAAVRQALFDPDPSVRETAIRGAVLMNDVEAAGVLATMVNTGDLWERVTLIQSLSALGGPEAREAIISQLREDESAIRKEAATALGRLGQSGSASNALLKRLGQDQDPAVREAAAYALAKTHRDLEHGEIVEALFQAIGRGPESIQTAAIFALGQIGDQDTGLGLLQMVGSGNSEAVRIAAAQALGWLRVERAMPALREAAADEDSAELRSAAVSAIGAIGGEEAIGILLEKLDDEDRYVRGEAKRALDSLEPISQSRWTAEDNLSVQGRLLRIEKLSDSRDPDGVGVIIEALGDESSGVRVAAIDGLSAFTDPHSVALIVATLESDDPVMSTGAALALGRGSEDPTGLIVPALLNSFQNGQGQLRADVVRALGSKSDPRSRETIFAAAEDRDPDVRVAATEALAVCDAPEARERLEIIAREDPSHEVRTSAIRALNPRGIK